MDGFDVDPDMVAGFLDEASENISTLSSHLLQAEHSTLSRSDVDDMFRARPLAQRCRRLSQTD